MQQNDEIETLFSDSDQTFAVPTINFKRFPGAASVIHSDGNRWQGTIQRPKGFRRDSEVGGTKIFH